MKTKVQTVNIQNKKARFEFEILDKYTAGIVLRGTEIKAIREGKAWRVVCDQYDDSRIFTRHLL